MSNVPVPYSPIRSRIDSFLSWFVEHFEQLRQRYGIPTETPRRKVRQEISDEILKQRAKWTRYEDWTAAAEKDLFQESHEVPAWVDFGEVEREAANVLRSFKARTGRQPTNEELADRVVRQSIMRRVVVPSPRVLGADGNALRSSFGAMSSGLLNGVTSLPEDFAMDRRDTIVGTPFDGMVPQVEVLQELTPFRARGLNMQLGQFDRMTGMPQISDAIRTFRNFFANATYEWAPNDQHMTLDDARLKLYGTSIDQLMRDADLLNEEFAMNPALDMHTIIGQQVRDLVVYGFSLHEFTMAAPSKGDTLGRRIRSISPVEAKTVLYWICDRYQDLRGFVQLATPAFQVAGNSYATVQNAVDVRKCIYAAHDRSGANFEGVAVLRPAYTAFKAFVEFLNTALMWRARVGSGMPILRTLGTNKNSGPSNAELERIIKGLYSDRDSFLSLPEGMVVEFAEFNTEEGLVDALRFFAQMAREAVGLSLNSLGTDGVGSYSAMSERSEMLNKSLNGFSKPITRGFDAISEAYLTHWEGGERRLFPRLKINGLVAKSPKDTIEIWDGVLKVERENQQMTVEERNMLRSGAGVPKVAEEVDAEEPVLLNGAQLAAVQSVVTAAAAGEIPVATVSILAASAGMAKDEAANLQDSLVGFTAAPPQAPSPPQPVTERSFFVRRSRKPNISVDCRGGSFMTWRPLTRAETRVNFPLMIRAFDSADSGDLTTVVRAVAIQQATTFAREAAEAIANGDASTTSRLSVDYTEQYAEAIQAWLEGLSGQVKRETFAELQDQLDDAEAAGDEVADLPKEDEEPLALFVAAAIAGTSRAIDTYARILAASVNGQMNQALRREASKRASDVAAGKLSPLVQWAPDGAALVSKTLVKAEGANAISAVINASRTEEIAKFAQDQKVTAWVTRSEVMDSSTCGPCEEIDLSATGAAYRLGTPEALRMMDQYDLCASVASGRGNFCRGIGVMHLGMNIDGVTRYVV